MRPGYSYRTFGYALSVSGLGKVLASGSGPAPSSRPWSPSCPRRRQEATRRPAPNAGGRNLHPDVTLPSEDLHSGDAPSALTTWAISASPTTMFCGFSCDWVV